MEELRLKDILGKQNYHEVMEKSYEPFTDTIESTFVNLTKTFTETSNKNNQALGNLKVKLLKIINDRGKIATHFLSPLSEIINPEHTSQFKLVRYPTSNRINNLFIDKTKPVALYNILLTFRETDKKFELQRDLLKMINNKNYGVDLANLQGRN